MSRRKISDRDDAILQGPIVDAINVYFDVVYEPGSRISSVGTAAADGDSDQVVVYQAFRIPRSMLPVVSDFLDSRAESFSKDMMAELERRRGGH